MVSEDGPGVLERCSHKLLGDEPENYGQDEGVQQQSSEAPHELQELPRVAMNDFCSALEQLIASAVFALEHRKKSIDDDHSLVEPLCLGGVPGVS